MCKGYWPDWKPEKPMELAPVVNLVSIAEFDENHSTILLNLVVTLYWKDTRIALKSNKPDE